MKLFTYYGKNDPIRHADENLVWLADRMAGLTEMIRTIGFQHEGGAVFDLDRVHAALGQNTEGRLYESILFQSFVQEPCRHLPFSI